ncbi:hypothetical protein GC089_11195 [Cellulomonas sp. JZ18]|uniref:hypothetical protein n=1 Tax=Cellulomonas sp. JZ18 TaxID=2654191 RepID=UPI0012D4A5FF|nr:hypothetical protein [Cellulomonas sp. JZ18]QGQ19688.1 hypothetical protein GC089_11195 [Cellulomonas sp. JZ18]
MSTTADEDGRTVRRRRLPAVAAVLGLGLATGAGVASTSAAWTDDAWFSASASAATAVDLRGSTDGVTYVPGDDGATAVVLDAVTGLTPDAPVTRTLHLWNASTVPLRLQWVTDSAGLGGACVDVELGSLPTNQLPAGPDGPAAPAVTTTTVTFRVAPDATPGDCAGQVLTGLEIVVLGSTA